ncbi:MAG: hypothetical protein MUC88_03205 [Planctomycetes bacterium]|jgi:hypothetical protein|nr:hypothetical protein [Planctomycetota bacterium]
MLRDLHLETEPLPEYNSPPVEERRTKYNLAADEKDLNALELFTRGIARVLGRSEAQLLRLTPQDLEDLRHHGRPGAH